MPDRTPHDRTDFDVLERRITALEGAVARLVAATGLGPIRRPPAEPAAPPAAQPYPELRAPATPTEAAAPPIERAHPAPRVVSARQSEIEQWLGARGLLAVGVIALLMAAGFMLKYAFDHGWIAPWMRVAGAIGGGIGVAVAADIQIAKGLRPYGLALVGAGGGLVYLGVWAATGPYALLGRQAGVLFAALASALVVWRAVRHEAEPLAIWALIGAFLAPILLPTPDARPGVFLGYLAAVGAGGAALSSRGGWRTTLLVALAGYLVLAGRFVPDTLRTPLGFWYLAAGGIVAVRVSRPSWSETRLGGLGISWLLMLASAPALRPGEASWAGALAATALLLVAWWHHRGLGVLRLPELRFDETADVNVIAFVVSPLAFAAVVSFAAGPIGHAHPAIPVGAAAALYVGTGWRGRWAPFLALGSALAAVALALEFPGAQRIVAWSTAIVIAVAADRRFDQRGIRPLAVVLIVAAGVLVLSGLAFGAPDAERAFTGPWSVALYAYLASAVVAALLWRRLDDGSAWVRRGRELAWAAAGVVTMVGMSLELQRFFELRRQVWAGADLAGDLAISVWWLVYAALLVALGFWRSLPSVRFAGLAVAGLAAAKIALYDLSRLEALYRVAAFFVLSLIALAVAYAYNRRAKPTDAGAESP